MTTDAYSPSLAHTDDQLWRAILADLGFWAVAGSLAALLALPVGNLIDIRPLWFALSAAGLAVASVGLLVVLGRQRPVSRGLVRGLAIGNVAVAPVLWLTAFLGWLPLSTAGNWGLALCADAMFLIGLYQLYALRRAGQLATP